MKLLKISLVLVMIMSLSKGSPMAAAEAKSATVRGKIMFSDYYSMGGQKCTAFLETPEGSIICVLDNMNAADIKRKLGGRSGHVNITGTLMTDPSGRYLEVEEYRIMRKPKGPTYMEEKIPRRERVGPRETRR
ncbi:MAG: OB-fold nucleic acid binding domain-containing protein [Candidatus Omnitrophota bacterium]